MKLRERVGKLEQRTVASIGDEGGCWPILLVELTADCPDEETAVARARAAALAEGRHIRPISGDPHGPISISMVIVDLRSLQNKDNGGER